MTPFDMTPKDITVSNSKAHSERGGTAREVSMVTTPSVSRWACQVVIVPVSFATHRGVTMYNLPGCHVDRQQRKNMEPSGPGKSWVLRWRSVGGGGEVECDKLKNPADVLLWNTSLNLVSLWTFWTPLCECSHSERAKHRIHETTSALNSGELIMQAHYINKHSSVYISACIHTGWAQCNDVYMFCFAWQLCHGP